MNSNWRQGRKALIIFILILLLLSIVGFFVYPYFNKPATCFDGKQNGDESGVDCGGSCKLVCVTDVIPLDIKFAKAIPTDAGLYDLVVMINNKNKNKDTLDGMINYSFDVYDRAGSIIKNITGSTSLPLGQTFPIIIQNVPISLSSGNQISNVFFNVVNDKPWQNQDSTYARNFFKVVNTNFKQNLNNISQLTVTLKNLSKAYFRNVPVKVLLYDDNKNLIAVNESLIKEINGGDTQDVFFTWRYPLQTQNPKIEVYSIVTPNTYIK